TPMEALSSLTNQPNLTGVGKWSFPVLWTTLKEFYMIGVYTVLTACAFFQTVLRRVHANLTPLRGL
ncbi:MAG: hypothetical protein ACPGRX_06070, partial [Bdellovibrionales bacterium]